MRQGCARVCLVVLFTLLAEAVEGLYGGVARLISIHLDVVPDRIGRVDAYNAVQRDVLLINELLQHGLRFLEELLRLLSHLHPPPCQPPL